MGDKYIPGALGKEMAQRRLVSGEGKRGPKAPLGFSKSPSSLAKGTQEYNIFQSSRAPYRQGGNYHDHLDEIQYSTLGQAAFIGVYLMFKVFSCLDFKKFGSHWNSMNVCPLTCTHTPSPNCAHTQHACARGHRAEF